MFKKILSDSFVYGAARVMMMAVSMFMVPIYSRHFSRSDYGIIETFNMFINLVMLVLPCGISQSIFRLVHRFEEPAEKKVFFSTILNYYLILAAIFLGINLAFHAFFTKLLISDSHYSHLFIASCIAIVFQLLNNYNLDILRSQFQKTKYLIVSVGTVVLLASGGIYTVIVLGWGVKGFFYASAFTHVVFFIVGFLINAKWFTFSFSKDRLLELLRIGLPFIPAGLSLVLMKFLDRIVVQRVLGDSVNSGLDYLGVYAMAIKITSLFDIVGQAFASAWFPWAMKIADEPDAKKTYKELFLKIIVALSLLTLLFASLSKIILHVLVDAKFWDAGPLIFLLLLASMLSYANYIIGVGIYASGKTKFISLPPLISGIANLVFCYLLARYFGLMGVAISVVIGSFIYLAVSYYLSEKVYPIKFDIWKGVLLVLALFVCLIGISRVDLLSTSITIQEILLKATIFTALFLLVYNLKVFDIKGMLQTGKNALLQKIKSNK